MIPPTEGSFLSSFGIKLSNNSKIALATAGAALTAFVAFIETDVGQGFMRGLTGHEPSFMAEQLGKNIRQEIIDPTGANLKSSLNIIENFFLNSTKIFLQSNNSTLIERGIKFEKFSGMYSAKNGFYETLIKDELVQSIGFEKNHNFPIHRSDFSNLVLRSPLDSEEKEWLHGITNLKVTSPNWNRNDKSRQWKGYDTKNRTRYFHIEDNDFWLNVRKNSTTTSLIYQMKVQWIFQGSKENPVNCIVLKVIDFNDVYKSKAISLEEIESTIKLIKTDTVTQPDLI